VFFFLTFPFALWNSLTSLFLSSCHNSSMVLPFVVKDEWWCSASTCSLSIFQVTRHIIMPFLLNYVKWQHNTWNDNLEVGVLTEGFDKFTLFRLNDGAVSILRLQVRVAKTSFFLPRIVGVWFPFIRLLYKWERLTSWLHCTLPFETVFAVLFLTTSAWFLVPRRNADSDVLQWLCRGNVSFCLMPWLILCHYRRGN
jgi:hypothetical protein